MTPTPARDREVMPMPFHLPDLGQEYRTVEKSMDELAGRLIDSNWKEQPMRLWDDVYDDLCREVGSAYGLNDIREA